ncbi:hypothetical protein BGW36DRAFT_427876 [Talaromyces proteolyticus]|uniref:Zn(2)-C6 fungal-type domain-containing protein n=1 Tax=Talaromyces proteolyticus TaxID=1131652 RepID=A0AAD4KQB7_9EURO|nr:uncharacterized protein BGW36DRAFT_427876 [Talaromyces proteolyticus]KAH8697942.1 hypothetical protein BGW36DRAFT_427876 [Talaromyces proteolyticus]
MEQRYNQETCTQVKSDHAEDLQAVNKRTRYALIACNGCRKRKARCSGGEPCDRCAHLSQECHYDEVYPGVLLRCHDIKKMQTNILTLQNQIGQLVRNNEQQFHPHSPAVAPIDFFHYIDESFAIKLLLLYDNDIGNMTPVVDTEEMRMCIRQLYAGLGSGQVFPFDETKGKILRWVILIALSIDPRDQSEMVTRLLENCKPLYETSLVVGELCLSTLVLLILEGLYHFHQHDEMLAGRIISLAARMSLELGIHSKERIFSLFPSMEERSLAIRVFWSIYVLDRRWSIGNEIPFALSDSDIDPLLPVPQSSFSYLRVMIAYSRITGKIWSTMARDKKSWASKEASFLNYQIQTWFNAIPSEFKWEQDKLKTGIEISDNPGPRSSNMLIVLLHLRWNQARLLLSLATLETVGFTDQPVSIAEETILLLRNFHMQSATCRLQQTSLSFFVISALEAIFLSILEDPETYGPRCRSSFYSALDLIRCCSHKLIAVPRLWNMVNRVRKDVTRQRLEFNLKSTVLRRQATVSNTAQTVQYYNSAAYEQKCNATTSFRGTNQAIEVLAQIFEELTASWSASSSASRAAPCTVANSAFSDPILFIITQQPDFLTGDSLTTWDNFDSEFRKKLDTGHTALIDYPKASALQKIASQMWTNGGIVTFVCHGPAIFGNVVDLSTHKPKIKGKKITGFNTVVEHTMVIYEELNIWDLEIVEELAERLGATYKSNIINTP